MDPQALQGPPGFAEAFRQLNPSGNLPLPRSGWAESEQRFQREQKAGFTDYVGSIWRQDGLVADLVGSNLMPQEGYFSGSDPQWSDLSQGIWDEYLPALYRAHSPTHAQYIKDRLLQKQEDLTRLGDMGAAGTVGRIALNAVMPDQLLAGMAGGWVARGIKAAQTARAVKGAAGALAQAEAATAVAAKQAVEAGSARAVAGGIASGATGNAAFEALRQSVNFEDDSSGVLAAGLLGAALSAPFAIAGARSARRVADTAYKELEALQVLRAVDEGAPLTPEQGDTLRKVLQAHHAAQEFNAGRSSPEALEKALGELHGPQEPAERWLARFQDRLRAEGQQYIAETFPNANGRATGMAPPSAAQRAQMAGAVDLETKVNFPESVAAANARNPELAGPLKSAFKVTLEERAALRKAFDLQRVDAEKAGTAQAERSAAFDAADQAQAAQRAAAEERAFNARELQTAAGDAAELQGRSVSWADDTGRTREGTAVGVDGSGNVLVETPRGTEPVPLEAIDQLAGPAPFGMQSVGAAQVQGTALESIASQRTALAEMTIPGTTIKVPTRFDVYATLNGSPVKRVRELAYKLVKDAIQNDAHEAQGWTATEWKAQLLRTVKDRFHFEAGESFKAASQALQVPIWRAADFARDFYAMVSSVARGDDSVLLGKDVLAAHVRNAAKAQAQVYRTLLEEAKKVGVKGAEEVQPNDFYVNRVWHHGRMREAFEKHGAEAVHKMVADAIVDKAGVLERFRRSPGAAGMTDEAILLHKAERFIGAVRALEFSSALQDIHLTGRDMGTLRRELELMDVPHDRIDDLVELMFQVRPQDADAGRTGSLKFRFGLDESVTTKTPAGDLKLTDLFENDARVLVDTYAQSMAGHIGLAKAGIPSQAAWQAELKRVADEAAASPGIDGARVRKDVALLQDIQKHLLGRPMSSEAFSYANRSVAAMRGYTRAVMLPQLGITSGVELLKATALMGFRSLLQLPSFRSLLHGIRRGYVPDEGLARDILLITGFGQEKAAQFMRAQEIETGFMGQSLTRAETGAAAVSHAVNVLSGNATLTSLTKQLSGMMAVQDMADIAHGRKGLTPKLRERWTGQGLGTDDVEDVLGDLKRFSSERSGVVEQVRYEDWLKDSPRTYERFQLFLSRQVRDAIQDHDFGETMPFMHGTLGKVFAELKTFTMVGHAKNFLKNLHYADTTALQVWTIGFMGECLAYMTQTAINYPDELDERLDPERIATAALFRMSALGTASLLVETGYSVLSGGDSLVRPGTTANTDNRSFLNTPSLTVAGRLLNAPSTLAGAVLGTGTTTQREFRDLWSLVPGANLYGLKAVGNWVAEGLPKSEPVEP